MWSSCIFLHLSKETPCLIFLFKGGRLTHTITSSMWWCESTECSQKRNRLHVTACLKPICFFNQVNNLTARWTKVVCCWINNDAASHYKSQHNYIQNHFLLSNLCSQGLKVGWTSIDTMFLRGSCDVALSYSQEQKTFMMFAPCITTIISCILYCDYKWHKRVHKEVGHCRSFPSTLACLLELFLFTAAA